MKFDPKVARLNLHHPEGFARKSPHSLPIDTVAERVKWFTLLRFFHCLLGIFVAPEDLLVRKA